MAKTARRSVASDPSSPHSKPHFRAAADAATSPVGHHQLSAPAAHQPYTTQPPSTHPISNNRSHVNHSHNASSEFGGHRLAGQNSSNSASSRPASPLPAFNGTRIADRVAYERERVRVEFYATYDVMTGVRIAATLGGFFGLMVFLVVYKSRGESQETIKALKDPKIAAVAAAVMQEEEDRELQEAMDATGMSIYPDEYDHIGYRRGRMMSVGNISAPPVFNRGYRFSSIGGGYSSLLRPASSSRRYSCSESGQKLDGTSGSARVLSAYPMGGSFGIDDYFPETDGDEADDEYDQVTAHSMDVDRGDSFLSVPDKGQESRRSSNITCCSTESSYLERRCSAMTLGINSIPPIRSRTPSRRQSTTESWDYYYPGIQITGATPKTSPCPSERSSDRHRDQPQSSNVTKPPAGSTEPPALLKYRAKSLSIEEQQRQDSIDTISVYSSDDKLTTTATATSHDPSGRRRINTTGSVADLSTTQPAGNSAHQQLISQSSQSQPNMVRRAPLASLSSFKISSIDYQDSDLKSLGSDSVFAESYADTDDEMDQFSLDSDETGISDAQSPPSTRSHTQHLPHSTSVAAGDALRRHSMMASRHNSVSSKGSTASTTRPSAPTLGTTTICTTLNEREPKTLGRGRRILQRSSTIYPSSESLSKTTVPTSSANTFETLATIERTSPSVSSTASSSTSAPSSASVIPQHLFSTPPTTRKSEPLPPSRPVRPKSSPTTRPASYSGSTHVNPPPKLSNVFSSSQRSNNIPTGSGVVPSPPSSSSLPFDGNSSHTKMVQSLVSMDAVGSAQVDIDRRLNPSTSVIIELPVISVVAAAPTVAEDGGDPPIDPSLPPGAKRKWSKETLF